MTSVHGEWEHGIAVFTADADAAKMFLAGVDAKRKWAKYHPAALTPELNEWGKKGWELVSLEPYHFNNNDASIMVSESGSAHITEWTAQYLAVFRRRR